MVWIRYFVGNNPPNPEDTVKNDSCRIVEVTNSDEEDGEKFTLTAEKIVLGLLADKASVISYPCIRYLRKNIGWVHLENDFKRTYEHSEQEAVLYVWLDSSDFKVPLVEKCILRHTSQQIGHKKQYTEERPIVEKEKLAAFFEKFVISNRYPKESLVDLMKALQPLTTPKWKTLKPSGILFYGPPGTGKSFLADQILKDFCGEECILFSGVAAQLDEKYVGESTKRLMVMLEISQAQPDKLFGIFIDEIHGLARQQDKVLSSGSDSHKMSTLQTLLGILSKQENILFLFATNYRGMLDRAFMRSKRVDSQIFFPAYHTEMRAYELTIILDQFLRRNGYERDFSSITKSGFCSSLQAEFAQKTLNFTLAQFQRLQESLDISVESLDVLLGIDSKEPCPENIELGLNNEEENMIKDIQMYFENNVLPIVESIGKKGDFTHPISLINSRGFVLASDDTQIQLQEAFDPFFQGWLLENTKDVLCTGRMSIMAPSMLYSLEGPGIGTDPLFYPLPSRSRGYIHQILRTIITTIQPNFVHYVDAGFRNLWNENLDAAFDDILDMSQSSGKCLVVIEMDELVGLIPHSVTTGIQHSRGEQVSHTKGKSNTVTFMNLWGSSSSLSSSSGVSRNWNEQKGTSGQSSVSYGYAKNSGMNMSRDVATTQSDGIQKSWGESLSANQSLSQSISVGYGKSQTKSSSVTDSLEASVKVSPLELASLGASRSWQKSYSTCETQNWGSQISSTMGTSFQKSSGLSTNKSISQSQRRGYGISRSTNVSLNFGNTSGTSNVIGSGSAQTHQEQRMNGKMKQESKGEAFAVTSSEGFSTSSGSVNSQSITLQQTYPAAACAVVRFLGKIDRTTNSMDPFVVVLYRNTEPGFMTAMQQKVSNWETGNDE